MFRNLFSNNFGLFRLVVTPCTIKDIKVKIIPFYTQSSAQLLSQRSKPQFPIGLVKSFNIWRLVFHSQVLEGKQKNV